MSKWMSTSSKDLRKLKKKISNLNNEVYVRDTIYIIDEMKF